MKKKKKKKLNKDKGAVHSTKQMAASRFQADAVSGGQREQISAG